MELWKRREPLVWFSGKPQSAESDRVVRLAGFLLLLDKGSFSQA